MWTNISASTKASCLELEAKRNLQHQATEEFVKSNQSETVLSSIDPESVKNCGSPLMRYKHAVCSAQDGFIYIHGGRFGNLPLDDDIWRFDPHHNSWIRLTTTGQRPSSLQEHTLVEYGRQLYLFGGQVSTSSAENSFWQLSLSTYEWQSLDLKSSRKFGAYLGPTNRRGHSAVVYGNSMFIYGGFEDFRGSSGQLWEYEFANRRWLLRNLSSTSACQPEPRHSHSAIVYCDSMYIYGGLSNLKSLGDLWRWSWPDKRWYKEKTRGNSPGQLHGHAAIQAFGSMFVFGGERADGRPTRGLWRLNLSNLTWQKIRPKGPRPSPTTWHGAIANPLNMLDETNYIIEGDETLATIPRSTLSDSSIVGSFNQPGSKTTAKQDIQRSEQQPEHTGHQKQSSTSSNYSSSPREMTKLGTRNKRLKLSFLRNKYRSKSRTCEASTSLRKSNSAVASINFSPSKADDPPNPEAMKNSKILDNLDSDIKEMFQNALLPARDESESLETLEDSKKSSIPTRLLSTTNSQYETANSLVDSYLVSQRTSLAGYTTPPTDSNGNRRAEAATSARRDRPKSEIVQSLIDRADDRIKHLYTPLFTNQLAEARLRHRKETHSKFSQQTARIRPERFSLDARTQRHTIHQTMTYYNLYFSERDQADGDTSQSGRLEEDDEESSSPKPDHNRDDLSIASTIKGSAALVSVHSGGTGASANKMVEHMSEVSSSAESDTRTLRLSGQIQSDRGNLTPTVNTFSSFHSALTTREQTENDNLMHVDQELLSPHRAESATDDTSLSFSVIAEFEEDDMLQYSSPTDPNETAFHNSNRQTVILGPSSSRGHVLPEAKPNTDRMLAHKSASSGYGDSISAGKNSESTTSPLSNKSSKLIVSNLHRKPLEPISRESGTDSGSASIKSVDINRSDNQAKLGARESNISASPQAAQTTSSITTDSLLMTSDTSMKTDISTSPNRCEHNLTHEIRVRSEKSAHSDLSLQKAETNAAGQYATRPKLFGKRKSKTRYWQLCMFVIGGKQGGVHGSNEPITVWRLYI